MTRMTEEQISLARQYAADTTRVSTEASLVRALYDEVRALREERDMAHARSDANGGFDELLALCEDPETDTLISCITEGERCYVVDASQFRDLAAEKARADRAEAERDAARACEQLAAQYAEERDAADARADRAEAALAAVRREADALVATGAPDAVAHLTTRLALAEAERDEARAQLAALREERDAMVDAGQCHALNAQYLAEKARADRAEQRMREAMADRDSRHAADEARIDEHRRARDRAEAERDEARAQLAALRDKVLTWASRSIGDTHETIERNELLHAARRSRPDASSADAAREHDARVRREALEEAADDEDIGAEWPEACDRLRTLAAKVTP